MNIDKILEKGPSRILINKEGEAVSPKRTNINPDIIFIREDGWSLGAPNSLLQEAYETWHDKWTHVWTIEYGLVTILQFLGPAIVRDPVDERGNLI